MNFFSDSVKNVSLFRRVTSSMTASVLALSFGICTVRPADAEETKRFRFCEDNKSLFHLDSGAKRKVRIAIFDLQNNSPSVTSQGQRIYQFQGHSDILAGELIKDNNFAIVNWSQIKPFYSTRDLNEQIKLEAQTLITLENLRQIRDKYGIEAILVGTVNKFEVTGNHTRQFLGFGEKTKKNEYYIKLNFRVIDTTTGEVVFAVQGDGDSSKSFKDVTIPKITVEIKKGNQNNIDPGYGSNGDSIKLTINMGGQDSTSTILSSEDTNVTEKLIALATENAIDQVVEKLNKHSDRLACLLRKPTLVADIEESKNKLILNKGKMHGYCKHLKLSIGHKGDLVKDPATGRILHIKTKKVGEIELTEVDSNFSLGTIKIHPSKINKVEIKDFKLDTEEFLVKPTNPEICKENSSSNKLQSANEEQDQYRRIPQEF